MTTEDADTTTAAAPEQEGAEPAVAATVAAAPESPAAADAAEAGVTAEGDAPEAEAATATEDEVADETGEAADEIDQEDEAADDESKPDAEPTAESVPEPAAPEPPKKRWYVIKVASNREESTKRNIERQIKVDNLEEFFGQIVIPVEEVVEVKKVTDTTKAGDKTTKTKKVTKKVKKFPGYIMAEIEWTPEVGAMLRGVSGVSGFVGDQSGKAGIGKPPQPMTDVDVQKMLGTPGAGGGAGAEAPKKAKTEVVKLHFEKGDKVRIREGAFANFEGEVKAITEPKEAGEHPVITVVVQVLGRPTPIDLEFWQVDKIG